tara:strand:+ start:2298 stop:2459 length:162 start_codon:yes stop_codon:yes gene_type:complete
MIEMEKLFAVQLQKEHAELIITQLNKLKTPNAQQLAQDLNERYVWNYRKSLIK